MFKLSFSSKNLQYVSLLSVTITLQSQTVAEKTKGQKKEEEWYDGPFEIHAILWSTQHLATTSFLCS